MKKSELQLNYAGVIGLLCECSVHLGNGSEAEELRDQIEQAVHDWCNHGAVGKWACARTLNRIEIWPK